MLASYLRKILAVQAAFFALLCAAIVWLMAWPWWAGPVLLAVLPLVLLGTWMLTITRRACADRRQWRSIVQAAFGEAWWSYRFFVTRLPWARKAPQLQPGLGAQARIPVVLVHGYLCNHRIWDDLTPRLVQRGHAVFAVDLEPVFASIDAYAPTIEHAVQSLRAHTGATQVALVGHSMGGLAIRAWMRAYGTGSAALAVTLGTPHKGTQVAPHARTPNGKQMVWHSQWLAELAQAESTHLHALFRIALTPQDAIVFPQLAQTLPGIEPAVLDGLGHVQLCSHPAALGWVEAQLDSVAA